MSRSSTITTDGNSPLSRYVQILIEVPHNLERLMDRDAEALRILEADPALPEALRRADRWYWDRVRERQVGKPVCTSRIWTRRDENWLRIARMGHGDYLPARRAARYLNWLVPRQGFSLHDQWFRKAINEARQDGTANVLAAKLERSKEVWEQLMDATRAIVDDDGGREHFGEAYSELRSVASELLDWTKPKEENMKSSNIERQESSFPSVEGLPKGNVIALDDGKIHWLAYPLKTYWEVHPELKRAAFDVRELEWTNNPPPLPSYTPDDDELAIVAKCFPDGDVAKPDWKTIRIELIDDGKNKDELKELNSGDLVRLFGRMRERNNQATSFIDAHRQRLEAEQAARQQASAEFFQHYEDFVQPWDAAWRMFSEAVFLVHDKPGEDSTVEAFTTAAKRIAELARGTTDYVRLIRKGAARCRRLAERDPTGKSFNLVGVADWAAILTILEVCLDETADIDELARNLRVTSPYAGDDCRKEVEWADNIGLSLGSSPEHSRQSETATATTPKSKRSTTNGEARTKIIAALTQHHGYDNGSCTNLEPVGVNKLAGEINVSSSTVSTFFKEQFQGHNKYKVACRNAGTLGNSLKMLNGELKPSVLFNALGDADREIPDE